MLVSADLGFRVAVFFVFVVFPAIGFILRRKWRIATARREEINRLLILASEEAARVEIEANFGYTATVIPAPLHRQCPVCYSPAPNRCARCKSVYYCTGKCQIIHWRQGHKDECHPPPSSFEVVEKAINYERNAVKQSYPKEYIIQTRNDEIQCGKQGEIAQGKTGFNNPVCCPSNFSVKDINDGRSDLSVKNGDDAVNHLLQGKGPDSLSETHGISFSSGVHASSTDNVILFDDSVSDVDSLHDLGSDSCESSSMFDNLENASSDNAVEQTKPVDKESYMSSDFGNSVSDSGSLNIEEPGSKSGLSGFGASYSHKNSTQLSPALSLSGFWDGSLDFGRTKEYASDNKAKRPKTMFGGSGDGNISHHKSSIPASPDLPGSPSSGVHLLGLKWRHDSTPATTGNKFSVAHTVVETKSAGAASQRASTMLTSKMSEIGVKDINNDGHLMKSLEVEQAGNTKKDSGFSHHMIEQVNDLDNSEATLPSLLSKQTVSSPDSPQVPSYSSSSISMNGNTPSAVKSTKVGATTGPQIASFTPSAAVGLKTSMLRVVEQIRAPRLLKQSIVSINDEKAIFPYDSFVKLYNWNKVELRPCGLVNCGNSCYANAVLQCLAFTPPVTAYLLQGLHSKECTKKDWCFTCEFERLIFKAKGGSSPLSPINILSQIQKIGKHLANGQEEDAHEFLRCAIDAMQSICLRDAGVTAPSTLEEETTLIGLSFGGYLRSKIKCSRCRGKSEKRERMMDLTVEIEGDIETLEDALRRFTKTESLDGENKYHCSRCKSYEKAKKKLSILEAPNVLTIALKRFQTGKFGKLNKPIRFPEILNLDPYMRGQSDKSTVYRLYGVVVHLDIMNSAFSGHYVSYVRNAHNKWYKTDDMKVKPVELERVLNKGAYMLFYSMLTPRAPRSIRSTIVSRDLSNKLKHLEVDSTRGNGRNHIHDDTASHGYTHPGAHESHILEPDSSSDSSSLFSHSDEVSSNTDSTMESINTDEISDFTFGPFSPWRNSSDSDTSSSSSSSSSSPLYRKLSPLSYSGRYASALSEQTGWITEESGSSGVGVSFLQSNSSSGTKQVRRVVNSSSCREAVDSEKLGWANPLDYNVTSDVNLRSSRKKAD